ncbi:MAG TPA: hypothetical protein VMR18_03140, partial [Candidatus Saccharimonadales bacterium]|nr:hypothetical protein [Candidatus Saccharimonadales bacterium]
MHKRKPLGRELFRRTLAPVFVISFAFVLVLLVGLKPQIANAATNGDINFQARLLTIGGAVVPDGTYNVDFKLYSTQSTGGGQAVGTCTDTGGFDCEWEENHTSTNRISVSDGYLSANLGSITAFPSTINWNQQQWLTMNIGGIGASPTWDGEMTPRIQLTALPYAFTAGQLQTFNSVSGFSAVLQFTAPASANDTLTLPDASGTICLDSSSACGFTSGSGTAFLVGGNTVAGTATLGTISNFGLNIETDSNVVESLSSSGAAVFQNTTNSTLAFQVQNAADEPIFDVGTQATTNLLTYPGFESGSFTNASTGWIESGATGNITQNSTPSNTYNGLYSLNLTTLSGNAGAETEAFKQTVTPGTYVVSFFAKPTVAMNASGFTITLNNGASSTCSPASNTLSTAGFIRVYCSVAIATNNLVYLTIAQNDSVPRTIYIDAVQLESGSTPTPYNIGTVQIRGVVNNPLTLENTANSQSEFQVDNASGTNLLLVDSLDGNVGIGITGAPGALFSVGGTTGNFQVTAAGNVTAGAITAVGVNSGAGLLQGSDGLTITGAAVSLNASSNFATSINTGGSTGTVSIGGGSAPLIINSTAFDVSVAGALSGITTISTSSTINTNTFNSTTLTFGAATDSISSDGASSLSIDTGGASTLNLGATNATTVNLGTAALASTIQIGDTAVNTGNTQAINIGDLNLAGTTNVTIGTGANATAGNTTVQANGNLNLGNAISSN